MAMAAIEILPKALIGQMLGLENSLFSAN